MSGQDAEPEQDGARKMRLSWPGGTAVPQPEGSGQAERKRDEPEAEKASVVQPEWRARDFETDSGPGDSRPVPGAYVRLADGVLQRLRVVGEDVNTELAELRGELATLRQAVEDVSGRVHLRQLRATIDDLRSDVTGLRRAVLEWPELERVSSDITALRADVTNLLDRPTEGGATAGSKSRSGAEPVEDGVDDLTAALAQISSELAELRGDVSALAERRARPVGVEVTALAPLIEAIESLRDELAPLGEVQAELAGLRQEVQNLKRRISLRAQ